VDFVRPSRPVDLRFVAGLGHYETVIRALEQAKTSVWIATANLKGLMVEDSRWSSQNRRGRKAYRSIVEIFGELDAHGVEIRILHATRPSRAFQSELFRQQRLARRSPSGAPRSRFEMRSCPRVHLKAVMVDGAFLYLGSANFTGAGLGAKGSGRRNFELGLVTDDALLLDEVQEIFDRIWRGQECKSCKLREECPKPLDGGARLAAKSP
jgi:phosphatidylserine/phosphatidylglycerophosphate/cardiolipin synthase-like enzyme